MMDFIDNREKYNKRFIMVTGFALIGILGIIDTLTLNELAFSLFYLLPIILVTWRSGPGMGIVASVMSAVVWLVADIISGNGRLHPVIYAWNTIIRLSFFVIIVLLLSKLIQALEQERKIARTDYLTGALNSRFFYDILQMEINRAQRYKSYFTLAYIDLDNFKTVNDVYGHATGDEVLCFVVQQIKIALRKTDVIARLGGDEFALLMPETKEEAARVVISKLQQDILAGMQNNHWPVTLSIGVLTCIDAPKTADEAINQVDNLMYSVKHSSKNNVHYAAYKKQRERE